MEKYKMKKVILLVSALICMPMHNILADTSMPKFTSQFLSNAQKPFLFGAATAAAQCEADCDNHQWCRWIDECNHSTTQQDKKYKKVPADKACSFDTKYKSDIKRAHKIGLTALRFSIEWSKVQPKKPDACNDYFDDAVLDRYEDMCKECNKYGIVPFITLYHYTEPLWFWDLGSFEKEENIDHFLAFCAKVFTRLNKYNPMWLTFNTPSGIMGKRYLKGERPTRADEEPLYKSGSQCIKARNFQLAGTVLKNVLNAHVAVYQLLKSLPGGQDSQIGFLKNIQQHDPYNPWNPLDRMGAWFANYLADSSIITFLKTGHLTWIAPGVYISEYNEDAPSSFDFIGLNYYTRDYIKNFKSTQKHDDIMCQSSDKVIYPEGIYRALKTVHNDLIVPIQSDKDVKIRRHIPIYVTENGIAARDEDKHRILFFEGYLKEIERAMKDGIDIRGYINWALMDNWSWGTYDRHYGLFTVDHHTQKRTLKTDAGTQYLLDVIKHNV